MPKTDTMKVDLPATAGGSARPLSDMATLNCYEQLPAGNSLISQVNLAANTVNSIHVVVAGLAAGSTHGYLFSIVDVNGKEGPLSAVYPVNVPADAAPFDAPTVESDVLT